MLRPEGRRPATRRLRWIVGGIAGVVVLALVAVGIYAYSLAHTFDSNRHVAASAFPKKRPPVTTGKAARAVNVLLVGIDDDSTKARKAGLSSTRSADMIAVLHIPAARDRIYLMSILERTEVTLPGAGRQPISVALARGGLPLQVQAVEGLVGVRMDHVAAVSIPGLKGLTDALGGVTVTSPAAFTSQGYRFEAGEQKLNGSQAVAFVRRGGAPVATGSRAEVQEAYLRGALGDLVSAKTLLNPAAMSTVVSVLSPYLTVDQGLDGAYVGQLGFGLRDLRSEDLRILRLPTTGVAQAGALKVLEVDRAALSTLRGHFRSDTLQDYAP